MSNFLVFNNIHLGLELLGAVIFFIIAWLFFEAYLIKKDQFSLARTLGFLFISVGGLLHAVYGSGENLLALASPVYSLGLLALIFSYGREKLPPRPDALPIFFATPFIVFLNQPLVNLVLIGILSAILIKRYVKDIDKLLKWLIIGFLLLVASSLVSFGSVSGGFNSFWIAEHIIKILGFLAVGAWGWRLLSLRIRDEALIVFVAGSLFISLLVTTVFSSFLLRRIENEARVNLAANAKILNFYIESLKNKSLSSAQIISRNEDLVSAVRERDLNDLEKISREIVNSLGQGFLTLALPNGRILFKLNYPVVSGENILIEKIGLEAIEGRSAVTISESEAEGFSIRASAPVFDRGKIIGAVITGITLDNSFAESFKKISNFETTVFVEGNVRGSSIFKVGDVLEEKDIKSKVQSGEEFVGNAEFFGAEVIGAFAPLKDLDDQVVGSLAITTTPGELLADAQSTNRLTMFVIFLIVLALIIPLYRFTVFLTSY